MRIGINASFLRKPGTGIGQVTLNVIRELARMAKQTSINDIRHEFFLYCEEVPEIDFLLPENFHIRVFLPFWKRDDLIRKMLWERRVVNQALQDDCEAFLSVYQSTSAFPHSIQHSMIVHDIIPRFFPLYRQTLRQKFFWHRVEQGIRKADHSIAVSESTKNDMMRELRLEAKKITVALIDTDPRFLMPISSEKSAEVLKKYDLQAGYIYHGGGLEIRKNTETLLRAYKILLNDAELKGRIPVLVISGKIFDAGNILATDVRKIISELHIEKSVRLLGFVPASDIPVLYKEALFFVYPSLYEGFGLPVLEALRMRLPVLCSANSSLPEVGGHAALYTNPRDTDAMVHQMKRLITDTSLRETMIAQSDAQALLFSWGKATNRIMSVLLRK